MIYSDFLRQLLLGSTAAFFLFFVAWAIVHRASLANVLGYQITKPNGESEFGAIYIGLFLPKHFCASLQSLEFKIRPWAT